MTLKWKYRKEESEEVTPDLASAISLWTAVGFTTTLHNDFTKNPVKHWGTVQWMYPQAVAALQNNLEQNHLDLTNRSCKEQS